MAGLIKHSPASTLSLVYSIPFRHSQNRHIIYQNFSTYVPLIHRAHTYSHLGFKSPVRGAITVGKKKLQKHL